MRWLAPPLTLRWRVYMAALGALHHILDFARGSRRFGVAGIQPVTPVGRNAVEVDLVICVHDALAEVRTCLSAVVRHTRAPVRLILVDDGSEPETAAYLARFAHEQGAVLIRNEVALGYTRAANLGLRASSAPVMVLLNSDTYPAPGWLEQLVACALSSQRIGLAGPLSNTASW